MMKKISPIEICVISTYVGANFSSRSQRMRLLREQVAKISQEQIQQKNNSSSASAIIAHTQKMEKLENIFAHAEAVISKVRSAQISDSLKDVTWDELQRWQDADNNVNNSHHHNNNNSNGSSSRPGSQHNGQGSNNNNGRLGNENNSPTRLHSRASNQQPISFPARDASQLLTQIIELLRLWNAQKRQLVEQFATHSTIANVMDQSIAARRQSTINGGEASGVFKTMTDGVDGGGDVTTNSSSSLLAHQKKGSSIFVPAKRGVAPDSSVFMAEGSNTNANNNKISTPTPPISGNGIGTMARSWSAAATISQQQQQQQQLHQQQQEMAASARVRNPRSIRQFIAASNTLVRSARRHVEAQRQASQRGESPQFESESLVHLRVVGSKQKDEK